MLGDLELISNRLKLENRSLGSQKRDPWGPSHIHDTHPLSNSCEVYLLRGLNLRLLMEKPVCLVLLHLCWRQTLVCLLIALLVCYTRR